ncbi:MAG: 4Fe-4S binding protein, partial [Azonexus sp.]|nr:4Fe-4S binding protein [Azonexus sp.]
DFPTLLKQGMVGHLRLTRGEVEALFADSEAAGIDEEALAHPEEVFVDLYIAYLNSPVIGRSVLGESQYREVMAGNFNQHHVWWIASAGPYGMVDDAFVPGSPSSRLTLAQDGLILESRDQGVELGRTAGPEGLAISRVFGVYAEAGFDPGQALTVTLNITRAKGMILPSLTHRTVGLTYSPPAELFRYPPAPLPEWLLAWKQRWLDLLILGAALVLLAG